MPKQQLTYKNAEKYLNAMLQEAGLPAEGFDLERGWEVFIAFCNTPMKARSDGVSFGWELRFGMIHYGATRQFTGDKSLYTHLHMEWQFEIDGEMTINELMLIDTSGKQKWYFANQGDDIEQLLRAEQQNPFHHRMNQFTRYQSFVYHDLI